MPDVWVIVSAGPTEVKFGSDDSPKNFNFFLKRSRSVIKT